LPAKERVSTDEPSQSRSDERVVLLHSLHEERTAELRTRCPGVSFEVMSLQPGVPPLAAFAHEVFVRVQSILSARPSRTVLLQVVIPSDEEQGGLLSAVSGILKSAQLENSRFTGQLIEVTAATSARELAD